MVPIERRRAHRNGDPQALPDRQAGDFFAQARSEWDPECLIERPFDVEKTLALFEESNRRLPSA